MGRRQYEDLARGDAKAIQRGAPAPAARPVFGALWAQAGGACGPQTSRWSPSSPSLIMGAGGKSEVMAASFGAESTADEVLEGIDLGGKRILVTGVSAGLGVET